MLLLLLFSCGLFAGTIDAIAGGGGLITLPVLLGIGLSPHIAFGTNKLQGSIGTFIAVLKFYRHGLILLSNLKKPILCVLIGATAGAIVSQLLSSEILKTIIPFLLLIILLYSFTSPHLGNQPAKKRVSSTLFYIFFGTLLGFYDGFFGPGTGSFWLFILTFFLGQTLIQATAHTKIFNLSSNIIATICFAIGGNIDYKIAGCMAVGQLIGGRLGAHLAISKEAKIIKPLFLIIVMLTILSLVYQRFYLIISLHFTFFILSSLILIGIIMLSMITLRYINYSKKS